MSVTLATHCHSRDLPRLHASGVLEELISCHAYPFDEILVTHQRVGDLPYTLPDDKRIGVLFIEEKHYPDILGDFGIPHKDPLLSEITHGWDAPHYYEHHCVNHCMEILFATSDYILFTDADCRIISQPSSWVNKAIEILESHPEALIVSPSDGGHEFDQMLPDGTRLTRTVSQQIFIGQRSRLLEMDFTNLKWDGQFTAPYGPFQEFYGMFEGHLWRWMERHNLYRAVLPEQWRYWHGEWH
jgi:hypothetical protein